MNEPRNLPDAEVLGYNRARLESLVQMVVTAIPSARTCFAADGSFGYVSATIGFENGLEVLAACDADLPQALFEVVRFVTPPQPPIFAFEARATLGAAFSDKLTREGAVQLLLKYANVPAASERSTAG